tara:strand:- start:303 stop:1043 length:741 start_codon:yes stop_codon:yes gene_type:complete
MAKNIAVNNGIKNPNLIKPGQLVNISQISTIDALNLRKMSLNKIEDSGKVNKIEYPILDKTLIRAVSKGFISKSEIQSVKNRIFSLARVHNFSPDDFARTTLMESDGMNPKASNGFCHGIIQLCAGGNRGASNTIFAKNPKGILKLSVLEQLDLVDRYFSDTKLKSFGPAGLDDLYLTILTPSARKETRSDVPLKIRGKQSPFLYEGRDRSNFISRNSIITGLNLNAEIRLGEINSAMVKKFGDFL